MKHLPKLISPDLVVEVDGEKFPNTAKGWAASFAKEKETEYASEIALSCTGAELHGKETLAVAAKTFSKASVAKAIEDVKLINDVTVKLRKV